jgi:hypothetical protein
MTFQRLALPHFPTLFSPLEEDNPNLWTTQCQVIGAIFATETKY